MRYGLSDLKIAVTELTRAFRELNLLYHTRLEHRDYYPGGIDVFSEDWDNLIILDACRYDYFKEHHDLPGELDSRISRGATSSEFITGNFSEKTLHDTVYISGNSWFANLCKKINSEVHDFQMIDSSYPDKPRNITDRAYEAFDQHPNKRLIVHYMLPHSPYIGEKAKKLKSQTNARLTVSAKRSGDLDITDETLRELYQENLDIVLSEVHELFDTLTGRTVVTADHGELLGDRVRPFPYRDYGHIGGMHVPELLKIPWLVYETGERRTIESDPPEQDNLKGISKEDVEDHLRDLGYVV
jgi:hypothetical protein